MSSKNKFLPLIQQRNKKRNKFITKINDSFLRDLSSSTLKNYHASFEDKNHELQNCMPFKDDDETVNLVKKYLQRFELKKKSLGKLACIKKIQTKENVSQKSKMNTLGQENQEKQKSKLIKIQALIKSLSLVQKQSKSPISLEKNNSTIAHLPSQEMRRMKSILFSSERRKSVLKSKQDILVKYGSLKNKVSKSLQNDIKVNQYKSGRQNKEKSAKIYNKLLTEQYTVTLVAKNPQQSYKYDKYDDDEDSILKTLEKPKYRYFETPQKNTIKLFKSPKIMSQKCSKKNFSYRLDTFEPWQNNIQSDQVQ